MLVPYSQKEKDGLAFQNIWSKLGSGYYMLQSTKPQTLGFSLVDSPVGLLAWIYEKMHDWTDDYPWSEDEGHTRIFLLNIHIDQLISSSYLD
jgi:hypothetical protein